jgi:general secretion pathway protein M
MQLLAAERRALRATPPIAQAQAVAALRAATTRLGDKARIVVQGDRATISLTGADGESLRSLLTEARGTAHARPVEVQLVRSARGLDGTLTLSLGGAS